MQNLNMHSVNMSDIDLNLLFVLKVLLEQRHVSKAAQALAMSQPSMSRALSRLRDTFSDDLLVRSQGSYVLTPRAEQLQNELSPLLEGVEQLLRGPQFDPAVCKGSLRIFGMVPQINRLLPPFIQRLAELAPGVQLEIDSTPQDNFAGLEQGLVHFAISAQQPESGQSQLHRMPLCELEFCLLMSKQHPLAEQPLTLDKFMSARFAEVQTRGTNFFFPEFTLKERGHLAKHQGLDVALRTTSFASVAAIAESSDLIFHLPVPFAEELCRGRQLCTKAIPSEARREPMTLYLYWHRRHHNDELCRWAREQLKELYSCEH
ncbi:LysR family transcriptional regulator [Aliagarivorans marinus]|uniref:LysR family transcriptional regulator n=1 Tax=Aliagarivorans marinus TaxID=561965 RepID=UPI000416096C|nr:LysR family transcriptional regulator [Aliagarivorans marinus]